MSFAAILAADRRLVLLRLLAEAPGYSANAYLLQNALGAFGHHVAADALRAELVWLATQGLVDIDTLAETVIATLTEQGLDVAAGRTAHEGVKRPLPGR